MAGDGVPAAIGRSAEGQYVRAKTSVWWDIENCQVPRLCDAYMIAQNISSALADMNYKGAMTISAYGDTRQINSAVQQALSSTGISLNHVPAGVKDASDKKILVDMLFWAVDNPPPANYLLISGDRDFSNALHQLRMRRYHVLLAQPPNVSQALVAAAKSVWLWTSLLNGGPPLAETPRFHDASSNGRSTVETPGISVLDSTQPADSNQKNQSNGRDEGKMGGSLLPLSFRIPLHAGFSVRPRIRNGKTVNVNKGKQNQKIHKQHNTNMPRTTATGSKKAQPPTGSKKAQLPTGSSGASKPKQKDGIKQANHPSTSKTSSSGAQKSAHVNNSRPSSSMSLSSPQMLPRSIRPDLSSGQTQNKGGSKATQTQNKGASKATITSKPKKIMHATKVKKK